MTTFGECIKDLRTNKGMPMHRFADEVGHAVEKKYYPSFVQRLENGETIPPERAIRAIALVLEADPEHLLSLARAEDSSAVDSERDTGANGLGRRVRQRRHSKGLSQRRLAQAVSGSGSVTLTPSSVSAIERGYFIPSVSLLTQLAIALEESPDTLLALAGKFDSRALQEQAEADLRVARLLVLLSTGRLSEAQLQAIAAVLDATALQ